jgi:cysteine protease ATG4
LTNGCGGAFFTWVQELFMDVPDAPFGLYRITEEGAKVGCPVGSWFGPSIVARTAPQLVAACPQVREKLTVLPALDGLVKQTAVLQEIVDREKAVLLLVPLMLGMGSIGKTYEAVLLHLLELPECVGIVGGKPSKSLYFVGHQGDLVFYLDPHVVQLAFLSKSTMGNVGGPRGTAPVQSLDPSMLACFFFETEEQFFSWCDSMATINREGEFPILTIRVDPNAARPSSLRVEIPVLDADAGSTPSSQGRGPVDECHFSDDDNRDLL